jgi:hypothetical protein
MKTNHPDCHECNLALQAVEKDEIHWYVDSGCSRYMIGDKDNFVKLKKDKGSMMFGDCKSTEVIGKGDVCLGSKGCEAKYVLLVKDMKHNLLSVSQMCDQGHKLLFIDKECLIMKVDTHKVVCTVVRTKTNIYVLNSVKSERCYLSKVDESWLWHRRLCHLHFDNLVKISK